MGNGNASSRVRERDRLRAAAQYAKYRVWLASLKQAIGCQLCGERFHGCLEFHHLDRAAKTRTIGETPYRSRSWFFSEAGKCLMLCANCHRKADVGLVDVSRLTPPDYRAVAAGMTLLNNVPRRPTRSPAVAAPRPLTVLPLFAELEG